MAVFLSKTTFVAHHICCQWISHGADALGGGFSLSVNPITDCNAAGLFRAELVFKLKRELKFLSSGL
jgi:hypothetical protein